MFDDDIRELVANELKDGHVVEFADTEPVFDLVDEGFPLGINRIAWEKIKDKKYAEIFPVATGGKKTDEVEARLVLRQEEVRGWVRSLSISLDEKVSWVGDSTDIGLTMSLNTLLNIFPRLFSLPQHSYVFPREGSWCINYVMEGELFCARAAK